MLEDIELTSLATTEEDIESKEEKSTDKHVATHKVKTQIHQPRNSA